MKKPIELVESTLDRSQQECVALLERILADAKCGNIHTIGIIAVGQSDFGTAKAGTDAAKLYFGAGVLQQSIITAATQPQRSSIIMRK